MQATSESFVPPQQLTPAGLVDEIVASEQCIRRAQARQATLLAEFARPGRAGDVSELVAALTDKAGQARDASGQVDVELLEHLVVERAEQMAVVEVSAALQLTPGAARSLVQHSMRLVDDLPATLAAWSDGAIDRVRAELISDRTSVLDPEHLPAAEAALLPTAASMTHTQLRPLIERAVVAIDPDAARKRAKAARKERRIWHRPLPDGMGQFSAHLRAEGVLTVFHLLDIIAGATAGPDGEPVDARRADALTDIAETLLTDGYLDLKALLCPEAEGPDGEAPDGQDAASSRTASPRTASPRTGEVPPAFVRPSAWTAPTRQGREVHLTVTIALSTLAALNDLPGELGGHGPITAEWARTLGAAARTVTLVVVDPATGHPVGISERTYRPRQLLRDQVITLAGTCTFPSCRQPAWRCQLDHTHPFDHQDPAAGGPTCLCNIKPRCGTHHLFRTHGGWSAVKNRDGTVTLTSPTGHEYHERSRQFTLPGEWLEFLPDAAREATGPGAAEHAQGCATPNEEAEPPERISLSRLLVEYRIAKEREYERELRDARARIAASADITASESVPIEVLATPRAPDSAPPPF